MNEMKRKKQYEEYRHFAEANECLEQLSNKTLEGVPDRIAFSEHFRGFSDNTVVCIRLLDADGKELWDSPHMFEYEVQYGDCEECFYFIEELVKMYPVRFIAGGLFSVSDEDWKEFVSQFDRDDERKCMAVRRTGA